MPIEKDVTYEKHYIWMLGRKLKMLRNKEIPLVKILWKHHKEEKATWDLRVILEKYANLFEFQLDVVL